MKKGTATAADIVAAALKTLSDGGEVISMQIAGRLGVHPEEVYRVLSADPRFTRSPCGLNWVASNDP